MSFCLWVGTALWILLFTLKIKQPWKAKYNVPYERQPQKA
jgi:hypothetical protein